MSNKISKSLQLNLFLTLIIGILNFIVNKYFANYMGLNMLGLMKLFTQLIAYLSLVDLGISNASTYALYKPLIEKNNHKINVVISTIDSFYKKISIIIFIIGMGLILFIPYLIDIKLYGKEIYIYWILYVINTSLGYIFAKYSILFTANQEYYFVRKVQGTGKIIFQLLQIICLIKIQSFALYIVIMMFENLYNYYFYRKHYRNNYKFIKKVKEKDNTIIKDMKNLFWHKIGTLIIHNTDYIVLTKYVSLGIVGIYSSYLIIYQMLLTIINIITPVLTPKIGIFVTQNSKEKIYKYWKELNTAYYFIATVFILCAYKLILPFIKLWLGNEFILSSMTVSLILVNLFIHLIRGITDIFKESCGFFNDIYVPILESILNFVFSLILVKKIGLNGVIIGTIISNITIILLLKPILVFKKCFDKNGYDYIRDLLKLFSLVFISIGLSLAITKKISFLNINTWKELINMTILLGIINIIIVFIVFTLDPFFRKFILQVIKIEKIYKKIFRSNKYEKSN